MSTHNICFYGELEKIITKYSSLTSPLMDVIGVIVRRTLYPMYRGVVKLEYLMVTMK